MFLKIASLASLALVAGCSMLNYGTVADLRQADPLSVHPADYALVLTLPEGLDIAPGSGRLLVAVSTDETTLQDEFVLARDVSGDSATLFVAKADHARVLAFQKQAKALKLEDPKNASGSLGFHLLPCLQGAGPADDATLSVAIRLGENSAPQPLLTGVPVQKYLKQIEKKAGHPIGPCG